MDKFVKLLRVTVASEVRGRRDYLIVKGDYKFPKLSYSNRRVSEEGVLHCLCLQQGLYLFHLAPVLEKGGPFGNHC